MRHWRIVFLASICAVLGGCASSGTSSLSNINIGLGGDEEQAKAAVQAPAGPQLDPEAALRLINDYRAKKRLKPLELDPRATKAAAMLAEDMAKHDRMSHYGPNNQDVGKRLTAAGYPYRMCAENIGVGQQSMEEMIEGWKKSPPHSKNMLLADARQAGIAMEYAPNTKYKTFWTLVLAAQ